MHGSVETSPSVPAHLQSLIKSVYDKRFPPSLLNLHQMSVMAKKVVSSALQVVFRPVEDICC